MPKPQPNKNNQSEVEMNAYAQQLIELQQKPSHVLKDIGDQWQTPKPLAFGLFAHFSQKIGAIVLDLFANEGNQLAPNFYTAEINAMTQDWAMDLKSYGGAAFGNPPYSRPCFDENGTPITGIEHVLQYCREQRELGAKIILIIKAGTSEGWWPEDADFIQFISGRIGFQVPSWYVPTDPKKDKPNSSGFASAVVIFDKDWAWERRPVERLSRHVLEMHGQMIIDMIESRANIIVAEREQAALQVMQIIPTQIEEASDIEPIDQDKDSPITEECESIAKQLDEIEQVADEVPVDDNHQLPFGEEQEDFADKTIEQIYSMEDETIPLLRIIMLILLFGDKTEYSHREIQFALTSLLTNGEATNAESQCGDALAICIAMQEFLRNQEATLQQQRDFAYVMFIHCLRPSAEPLYQNVKTLIKIRNVYNKCNGDVEATINELEKSDHEEAPDNSNVVDLADTSDIPEISAEWVKQKCMLIDHFTEFSEEQKQESADKIIQAVNDVYSEIPADKLNEYSSKEYVIYRLTARNPHAKTLLNVRSLRAEFRSLVQSSIKEVANG